MMWPKKHKSPTPTEEDVSEAVAMRNAAQANLRVVRNQDSYITGLASRLVGRRVENGFGDQIDISYTRRVAHE